MRDISCRDRIARLLFPRKRKESFGTTRYFDRASRVAERE